MAVCSTAGGPEAQVIAALSALGGIEAFVRKGAFVVIKPNIGWQRTPEQAANTTPAVVAALVRLCRKAGAGRVLVAEHTCDTPSSLCLNLSGIERAVKGAGGELLAAHDGYAMVRPGEEEPRVVSPPAHGVIACAV